MDEALSHFGIPGMKWGVRKEREAAYRKKLSSIKKNESVTGSDIKRFKYRDQPAAKRIIKTGAQVAASMIVGDVLSGRIGQYSSMSKKDIAKKVQKLATNTAVNVALNDALAKSASKRYTESGKRQAGTKTRLITKEDAIETGINVGIKAAYLGAAIGAKKYVSSRAERSMNEARFNAWGKNILTQSAYDVVGTSPSGVEVLSKRR